MTSGPSIVVRILGDMAQLGKNMDATATQGQTAANKMHTAFSGVLNQLNATGVLGPFGSALATADSAIDQMGKHAKTTGGVLLGVGGTVAGLGLALSAAGSRDAAAAQLQAAVEATGHSYDQYADKVGAAIKHQETFGHTADETQNALQKLTQATNDPKKALDLLNTATDLAAAKHEDLTTAAGQLGKAYNGNGRILKDFGITVSSTGTATKELATATKEHTDAVTKAADATKALSELTAIDADKKSLTTAEALKLRGAQDKVNAANANVTTTSAGLAKAQQDVATGTKRNSKALDDLSKKLSGQASAAANTFGGHLDAIKAKVEDQVATIGQKYGPAITAAGAVMTGLGATMEIAGAAVAFFKDQEILSTVATYAWAAALAIVGALEAASGITLIILAIVALIAIIAVVITMFFNWGAVLNGIKTIALDVFHAIVGAAQAAFSWIAANWPLLLAILTGPFGLAVYVIVSNFGTIMNFIRGIPGQIAGIAAHMWDDIGSAFVRVINDVIGAWNALHFTTPSVDVFGAHIGGETIGVPHINPVHLAQGGIITSDGLVYAHAGEAITPIPNNMQGPTVHVENVNVSEPIDIDLFMRRAAWAARTAVL